MCVRVCFSHFISFHFHVSHVAHTLSGGVVDADTILVQPHVFQLLQRGPRLAAVGEVDEHRWTVQHPE